MNYQEFKNAVLTQAAKYEIKDYELYYVKSEETGIQTYQTEVKNYTSDTSLGICFRCILQGQTGYASTENLTPEEAESLVIRAIENAKSLESDAPSFIHTQGDTYLSIAEENKPTPSPAKLIDFALALQKEVYQQDERVADGTQTAAGCSTIEKSICNSNGLDLTSHFAFDYCYAQALVSDQDEMYTGLSIRSGNIQEFDKTEIAQEAFKDAADMIGYTSISSGEYTVVFSNKVMANLLNAYSSIFSAEAAQKGLSLLQDKEDERIASEIITLTDDPVYPDALAKSVFDDEGAATYTKNVIENGTFKTFLHNLATANKAGTKTTGNGCKASYASPVGINHYSFYINPVKGTLEDLFKEAENGVYITSVSGMHAGTNAITGDFSLSSDGFRIENGVKTTPVKGITISGNFLQLIKDISSVGEDLKFNPGAWGPHRCGSPSVLVKKMTIAGE